MPDRLFHEAMLIGPWADVSMAAQNLYTRLKLVACDYGLHEADPKLLRNICFPRGRATWPDKIQTLLTELAEASLIRLYQVNGRSYFQLLQWDDRVRGKPKFPLPPGVTMADFKLSPTLLKRELEKSQNLHGNAHAIAESETSVACGPIKSGVSRQSLSSGETGSPMPEPKPKPKPKPLPPHSSAPVPPGGGRCQPGVL
ncbi:MAG: hypothetical protein L0Y58_23145 [Verrucomicrobia subdivision 3 bacterium]|nr:hypothetical protein [Limisphaerales bacterium]